MNKEKVNTRRLYIRRIILFTLCVIIFMVVYRFDAVKNSVSWLLNTLSPIILGVAFAYLLNPILVFFQKLYEKIISESVKNKKKIVKTLSIACTTIFGVALVVILLLLIIPEFLENVKRLIETIPSLFTSFGEWMEKLQNEDNALIANFGYLLENATDYLEQWLNEKLMGSIDTILSAATSSVIYVVTLVINFFVAIVVAVYTMISKRSFIAQSKKILYAMFPRTRANDILKTARHGHKLFGGFLTGKIIDSLIVGLICYIFMLIAQLNYPLLISVIVGFTNIIPFFGPFIGGIPCTMLLFLTEMNEGIIFGIFIIILQQIDGNIIGPKILGTTTGISEFWVTFALILFGGYFGIVGMIIGVPLFGVIYYLIKVFVERKLTASSLPVETMDYYKVEYMEEDGSFSYLPEPEPLDFGKKNKKKEDD